MIASPRPSTPSSCSHRFDPAFTSPRGFAPGLLGHLVDDDPERITSRVVVRTSGTTMTVFSFPSGTELPTHTTPHPAVLLVLEGALVLTLGECRTALGTGEAAFLPPGAPHAVESPGAARMLLTVMKDGG